MKRVISALVAVVIVLCLSAPFAYAENGRFTATDDSFSGSTNFATREQAVACFIKAVGIERFKTSDAILSGFSDSAKVSFAYREEMSAAVFSGLISGYEDKTLRPQAPITRIEALVILARALSRTELNEWHSVEFSDTPDWAKKHITRLASAGIVKGYGDGTIGAQDLLTLKQVNTLCDRITRLTGPMGDFYTYVNSTWLDSATVSPDMPVKSDSVDLERRVNSEISDIIFSLYRRHYTDGESFPEDSAEKRIINVYSAAANQGYRDKIGIAPIKEQLLSIEKAKNISELLTVMKNLNKLGFPTLISVTLDTNIYDTSKYLPSVSVGYLGAERLANYKGYAEKLFELAGEENPKELSEKAFEVCETLSSTLLTNGSDSVADSIVLCNAADLEKTFKNIDIKKYFDALGFGKAKAALVYNIELAKVADALFIEKNIDKIKAYLKAAVLDYSAPYLTTDMFDAAQEFSNSIYNATLDQIPADYATAITQELAGWELGSIYIDTYFPDNVKTAVLDMTEKILAEYEELINSCDIMTPETRSKAIKKLKNMKVHAAFPDNIEEYFSTETFRSIEDGGNLLEYKMQYAESYFDFCSYLLSSGKSASNDTWMIYPQTVNAMYDPVSNSITIPAGILHAPYFESGAEFEKNLGGIGTVIAHEISHAFDSIGSQFDENGNLANWWTEQDKLAFASICKKVIEMYDGLKVSGGTVNGELTLNENIADLAGMSCILSLAGANNPNLDKLFTTYAKIWRTKMTPEYQADMLEIDAHSPAKVRVNQVLSNFDEFYTCYGITESDGMYIPQEKRINIWD